MPTMEDDSERDYGNNIKVKPVRREGHEEEYRVYKGKFAVKNFSNEGEADAYARKLARR